MKLQVNSQCPCYYAFTTSHHGRQCGKYQNFRRASLRRRCSLVSDASSLSTGPKTGELVRFFWPLIRPAPLSRRKPSPGTGPGEPLESLSANHASAQVFRACKPTCQWPLGIGSPNRIGVSPRLRLVPETDHTWLTFWSRNGSQR